MSPQIAAVFIITALKAQDQDSPGGGDREKKALPADTCRSYAPAAGAALLLLLVVAAGAAPLNSPKSRPTATLI